MNYSQPYYNNVYGSTPYVGGGYYQQNQMNSNFQQMPQYPQYQQYQQPQTPTVSCKYVDSIDVVKANEVPMGGVGLFMKADMSELYTKSWNSDGTTKIITFKPVVEASGKQGILSSEDILKQLEILGEKIDKLTVELGS